MERKDGRAKENLAPPKKLAVGSGAGSAQVAVTERTELQETDGRDSRMRVKPPSMRLSRLYSVSTLPTSTTSTPSSSTSAAAGKAPVEASSSVAMEREAAGSFSREWLDQGVLESSRSVGEHSAGVSLSREWLDQGVLESSRSVGEHSAGVSLSREWLDQGVLELSQPVEGQGNQHELADTRPTHAAALGTSTRLSPNKKGGVRI